MRVAYLVNQYPRASHSFIRREILALEALGVDVVRFSVRPLREPLPDPADRAEAGRTRVVLDAGVAGLAAATARVLLRSPGALARALALAVRLGWRSDRGLLRHLVYLAEACALAGWLRRDGADHLHAHFGTNAAAVALLAHEVGGPPWSFTAHGSEEFDKPEFLGLEEKVRRAAFTVAISSFGRSQLWRWARYEDWSKVHVVRCGVDRALLDAPRTPIPPGRPRLACVARLVQLKGHLVLLEAAAQLAAEGLSFEIALVGDGPFRGPIEERIRALGLEGHVRMCGLMTGEGVREVLASSRALVLPSFAEGLPAVVMEALALGRPVISSAIAGVPELVEPGVTGWLVPPGSVEHLTATLREALRAPIARLDEMGRAGAALVARHHDANEEARRLADLFRRAAHDANGRRGTPDARPRRGAA